MSATNSPWQVWFRSFSPESGILIDIQSNRPMRVADIDRIERLIPFWKEIAAEDEAASAPHLTAVEACPHGCVGACSLCAAGGKAP